MTFTRRRIGGSNTSQREREPAMKKFREGLGNVVVGGWKHQCRCGSVEGKLYRRSYWCVKCGQQKCLLTDATGNCGCALCIALKSTDREKEGSMVSAEDVMGTVIGPINVTGRIYYQGREQGEMLIADTEFLLKRKANAAVTSLRAKYPNCYTEEGWELRVG